MFNNLKRKLSGVYTYDVLMEKSVTYLKSSFETEEAPKALSLTQLKNRPEWYKAWLEAHSIYMKDVAAAESRAEQAIKFRKAIVSQIESSVSALPFLTDEIPEDDKHLLAKRLHPDMSFEQVMLLECQSYVCAEASSRCLRLLSFEFGDAKKNDWFAMYCDLYSQYINNLYKAIIANEKDEVYVLQPLLKPLSDTVDETRQKVFQGYNWDYDKEEFEKEKKIREQQEAEQKAKEPPRQKIITNHQIEELSQYLIERYERLTHGELYRIESYSPTNPAGVLQIDTGIMLIAISECVQDKDAALDGLRKAMHKAFSELRLAPNNLSPAEINLNEQLSVLEIKEQKEQWLAEVALLATYVMYEINPQALTKEESHQLGRASVGNLDNAWEVYATTKNIFGYKFEKSFLSKAPGTEEEASNRKCCSDGSCIGLINEDGVCNVCGKPPIP